MATATQPETLPENPFVQDIEEELPPPTSLVIFGGTGDLAARKLLPAVYNLRRGGLLPEKFDVIGIGRREGDDERFRTHAHDSIAEFSRSGLDDDTWKTLEPNLEFLRGDLDDPKLFEELAERLARHEARERSEAEGLLPGGLPGVLWTDREVARRGRPWRRGRAADPAHDREAVRARPRIGAGAQ